MVERDAEVTGGSTPSAELAELRAMRRELRAHGAMLKKLAAAIGRGQDRVAAGLCELADALVLFGNATTRTANDGESPVKCEGVTLAWPVGNAKVTVRLPSSGLLGAEQTSPRAGGPAAKDRRARRLPRRRVDSGGLISVIMTTYNSGAYVERAVRSVLAQTHCRLELIVVDDASSDDTFEVLLSLSREDQRVRPLKMFKNRGTYWCKNFGIACSNGRYVTFQDSDDLSDANRLRLQLRELQSTQAAMCTCNYVRVDGDDLVLLNRGRTERKAIMAPLIDKEQVIPRAGYFDSVRISADDEFTRRVGIAFGQERICHVDRPLYRAVVRDGSLTNDGRTRADISVVEESEADQSYLSAPRREYVRQYQRWHERLKTGQDRPVMAFPQLRRPFAAPARLLADAQHGESYATASMASIPSREKMLRRTVASILKQVDGLNVYLNGYRETPSFLLDPKIHVVHSREYGDLRDNGKFFFLDSVLSGYHFTIDDDIVYPPDYVQKCIVKIEQYDRRAVVGCHGVNLASPVEHFMKGREVLHFKGALARDRLVNLLGTGTTAYHVDALELSINDFESPGMADLWLAAAAKRQRVPMIAIQRPEQWLKPLDEADASSLYCAALQDCRLQTEIARREEPWRLDALYLSYPLLQELLERFSPEKFSPARSTCRRCCSRRELSRAM
jgi:hypothetical protein